jgi:hypothetical protein
MFYILVFKIFFFTFVHIFVSVEQPEPGPMNPSPLSALVETGFDFLDSFETKVE